MNDADFLLRVLSEHPGRWIRLEEIISRSQSERGHGLTVHSRAADLRAKGHNVECRLVRPYNRFKKREVGRPESYYRLAPLAEGDAVHPSSLPYGAGASPSASVSGTGQGDTAPVTLSQQPLFDLPKVPAWR